MVTVGSRSSGGMTTLGALLGVVALLALLAGDARAAGPFEPNDSRETAHGPLAGDQYHTGAIETVNDVDWYYFYVKTYSQFDFASTMLKEFSCQADFYLRDKDGNRLSYYNSYFEAAPTNQLGHFYLTLDPGRYYLEVNSCTLDSYKFKISPGAALTTNRECGEAIVTRDSVIPLLTEASAELGETAGSLSAADAAVSESKAELAVVKQRWEKAKGNWVKIKRRIKRHPESPRFQNRERRRLRISRARVNGSLADAKESARARLTTAGKTRAEVLAKQAPLKAIIAQHTDAKAQAETQIAISC